MTSIEFSAEVELFGVAGLLSADLRGGDKASEFKVEVTEPPSFAEIIEAFAGLVVPGFRLDLPPPWDGLVAWRPPPFELILSGSTLRLVIEQAFTVVDRILDVTAITLRYSEPDGLSLGLDVDFLGEALDTIDWDPVTQPVPPVPTEVEGVFVLEHIQLGQRQRFGEDPGGGESPKTMDAVIERLAGDDPGLVFDGDAGWLFATRFSVLRTLDLDLLFWDPAMYGLVVGLRGEKAGSLAGIRFEILYRKISDDLGVYHADLELPTVMRRLELGAASITVPAIVVDLYTDGSFLIDLGFPNGLDFTRSGSVEIFPFVGQGGLYVGLLPAEALPELPPTPEGTRFAPILAAGLGLNVGVGKTIEIGALSAGATVTMVGVFEGVVAAFIDETGEQAGIYYRVGAQVGLIGHIYGAVNFGIVQAQVDILAVATASVFIEAHRPAVVLLEAGVSVELSVKVLFIRFDFSFQATVSAEFVIGAATTAPWDLPAGSGSQLLDGPRPVGSRPSRMLDAASAVVDNGPPFKLVAPRTPVVPKRIAVDLRFLPQVAIGTGDDGRPTVELVATVVVGLDEKPDGTSDFGRIVGACFRWAAAILLGTSDDGMADAFLDRTALARLQRQLGGDRSVTPADDIDHRLTIETVLAFWDQTFHYRLWPWSAEDETADGRWALFPMSPENQLDVMHDGETIHQVDFATHRPCSPVYQEELRRWFDRLRVVVEEEETPDSEPLLTMDAEEWPSMAALVMVDYCRALLRGVVGDAVAAYDSYPHRPEPGETLASLAERFGRDPVLTMALYDLAAAADHQKTDEDREGDQEPPVAPILDLPSGGSVELPDVDRPFEAVAVRLVDDHCRQVDAPAMTLALLVANLDTPGLFVAGTTVADPDPDPDPNSDAAGGEEEAVDSEPATYEVRSTDTPIDLLAGLARSTLTPPADDEEDAERDDDELAARFLAVLAQTPGLVRAGAVAVLPELAGFRPAEGQSLTSIAEAYDLDPGRLLDLNRTIEITNPVRLPDCRALTVADIERAFDPLRTVESTAASVTRYFLHGLRLPDPDEFPGRFAATGAGRGEPADGDLSPLYRLTGQQFEIDADRLGAVGEWDFLLGAGSTTAPVTPADGSVHQAAVVGYRDLLAQPEPTVTDLLAESITTVGQDRPFVVERVVQALGQPAPWTVPADDDQRSLFQLVPIPPTVRALIDDPVALIVSTGAEAEPVTARAFTRIDITARPVLDPAMTDGDVSRHVPGLYEIGCTDQQTLDDLSSAIDRLGAEDRIHVAYADPAGGLRTDAVLADETALIRTNLSTFTRPPDASDSPVMMAAPPEQAPTLASGRRFLEVLWQGSVVNQPGLFLDYRTDPDAPDTGLDVLLGETGRGTISILVEWASEPNPDDAVEMQPVVVDRHHHAVAVPFQSSDTRFIASAATRPTTAPNLRAEAELLQARPADQGGGLDPVRFVLANATTPGLVAPGTVLSGRHGPYTVRPGDDLLLIALALDRPIEDLADDPIVEAIQLLPGAAVNVHERWVTDRAADPTGTISIRVTRPIPTDGEPGSGAQLVAAHNLVGFAVVGTDDFEPEPSGLAMGPRTERSSPEIDPEVMTYRRSVPIARLARDPDDSRLDRSPYAAVGRTATFGFHLVDLYGNRSDEVARAAIPIGYRDDLLSIEEWPGIAVRYRIEAEPAAFAIDLAIDPARLIGGAAPAESDRRARIEADAERIAVARAQVSDGRITATLRSELDPLRRHPVDRTVLVDALTDARDWVEAVGLLRPLTVDATGEGLTPFADIAGRYQVSVAALAAANADDPDLLRRSAVLVFEFGADPGTGHVVESGETLTSIAGRHGMTVPDLAEANRDRNILARAVPYRIPAHLVAPENASGPRWYTTQARPRRQGSPVADTFRRIADRHGVTVGALIEANRTLTGILAKGRRVTVPGHRTSLRVVEHETLDGLLARAEAVAGRAIDPESLLAANEPQRGSGPLAMGAVMLIPPRPRTLTAPFEIRTDSDVAPLLVELTLERPAALVDRYFRNAARVWQVTGRVPPDLADPDLADPDLADPGVGPESDPGDRDAAGSKPADRLLPLARTFARAADGWRLGRESVPRFAAGTVDVPMAVRDHMLAPGPVASFHAPRPAATEPWTGDVDVRAYIAGSLTDEASSIPLRAVDLDRWSDRMLTAIERALGPMLAPRLARSDRASFDRLVAAKVELADLLADRTAPIVAEPARTPSEREAGRLAAAEVVRQRLRRRLDHLGRSAVVVDYRAPIDDFGSDRPTSPVRLFGPVQVVDGDGDVVADGPLVGEAKVEPGSGDGPTFELETTEAGALRCRLQWQPVSVEYDIGPAGHDLDQPAPEQNEDDGGDAVDAGEAYRRSRWVTFIEPPAPIPLGRQTVPIPYRRLPAEVEPVADRLVPVNGHDFDPLSDRRYRYEFDHRNDPAQVPTRIERHLVIDRNGTETGGGAAADGDPADAFDDTIDRPELARVLAEFIAAEHDLFGDLASNDTGLVEAALGVLAGLAQELVGAWTPRSQPLRSAVPPVESDRHGPGRSDHREMGERDRFASTRRIRRGLVRSQSRVVDGLRAPVVTGRAVAIANEGLVPGRATEAAFLRRSHPVGPAEERRFHRRIDAEVVVTRLPDFGGPAPSLARRVATALAVLSGNEARIGSDAAVDPEPDPELNVTTKLDVEIHAWFEVGPAAFPLRTSIGIWPRRPFEPLWDLRVDATLVGGDIESGDPGRPSLAFAVAEELGRHRVGADRVGRWVLRIVVHDRARAVDLPLLDYRRVVIPMDTVEPPNTAQ